MEDPPDGALEYFFYFHTKNTRSQTKYVFKTEIKIGKKYEKSPFYLGTRVWNLLDKETQESDSIYSFKGKIQGIYKKYNPLV